MPYPFPFMHIPSPRIVMVRCRMILLFMAILCLLTGCFTGIESTKKIKLSKSEEKAMAPTPEELLLADVHPHPHTEWKGGKEFIVVSDRGNVLFEPERIISGKFSISAGDTLRYSKAVVRRLPDGSSVTCIEFFRSGDSFLFVPPGDSANGGHVMSDGIPGLIDPAMIAEIAERLEGRTLWTLTPVWESPEGDRITGRRFEPVIIDKVTPGNMVFPIRIGFTDSKGNRAPLMMSVGKNYGGDSRSFASLFSLSDPSLNHPGITPDIWKTIREGRVEIGMTREECRLAKGNPVDVLDGRDYSHTQVIWTFGDGTVLHFVDGVLQGINTLAKDY